MAAQKTALNVVISVCVCYGGLWVQKESRVCKHSQVGISEFSEWVLEKMQENMTKSLGYGSSSAA